MPFLKFIQSYLAKRYNETNVGKEIINLLILHVKLTLKEIVSFMKSSKKTTCFCKHLKYTLAESEHQWLHEILFFFFFPDEKDFGDMKKPNDYIKILLPEKEL